MEFSFSLKFTLRWVIVHPISFHQAIALFDWDSRVRMYSILLASRNFLSYWRAYSCIGFTDNLQKIITISCVGIGWLMLAYWHTTATWYFSRVLNNRNKCWPYCDCKKHSLIRYQENLRLLDQLMLRWNKRWQSSIYSFVPSIDLFLQGLIKFLYFYSSLALVCDTCIY